jgi:hypothetical protein
MQDKFSFLKQKINESISELSSDYDNFDDYKKGVSNSQCFVYSQVDSESIPNICRNGTDGAKEFVNTMIRGRGIYTVLTLKEALSYNRCDAIVKYAVRKGACNNFLIFDGALKKALKDMGALTIDETFSQTCRRLFDDGMYNYLDKHLHGGFKGYDEKINSCKELCKSGHEHSPSDSLQASFLYLITQGEDRIELRKGKSFSSERRLDISNVDGWAFHYGYGNTLVFRTTDLIMPISYCLNPRSSNPKWEYCFKNPESFDYANNRIDAFRRARLKYPDTNYTEKTVCGFSLVKNGNKFNLMSARDGSYFSPIDFDSCTVFDPIDNEAAFTIKSEEDNVLIKFIIKSENYGKRIQLYCSFPDESGEYSSFDEISYDTFLEVMNSVESEPSVVNESVEEVYTHKDFNTFKKGLNNPKNVILYRASEPPVAKSEYENGPNYEYTGTGGDDSLYYGFGVYTVRNPRSILGGKYGYGICKYILKDGYKDFIIFDDRVRAIHDPGATVYDELVRLVPENILKIIDKKLKTDTPYVRNGPTRRQLAKYGVEGYKNISISPMGDIFNTASFARALYLTLQGRNLGDSLAKHAFQEILMTKTKIRGFVYNGGADGECTYVRDFNSLMPIAYSMDGGKHWISEDDNEERFNKINRKVHPWYQYRGEYENIKLRDKPVGNFSLVSGKQGYNYKDIWFHRPLLPIDVETATNFDPLSDTATFNFCGFEFEISVDDDMNATLFFRDDDGSFKECSYNDLMELIETAKQENIISKDVKIYQNNLLNPNNDRKK